MNRGARRTAIAAVAAWALAAFFFRLGEPHVLITNEAREGVYVRAMLRSGDFVAPLVRNHVENAEMIPDKPPLFHWVAAAITVLRSLLSGGPTAPGPELSQQFDEWTLRFPSALFAAILVISVAVLGAALVGERGALCAAAVLLTSAQFDYQARFGRVDMTFACFASLAILLAGRALLDPRQARWIPLAGGAAGLAVLTKGPLGAVLPALACGSVVVARRWRKGAGGLSAEVRWKTALVTLVVVALPWYVVASAARGGAVFRSQIVAENFEQFAGLNGRMNELSYVLPWLLDSFPWNLFAVAAAFEAWRRRDPGPRFCVLWWISLLAFFQIAAYKRRAYLLPALPAEALLAGWFIDAVLLRGVPYTPIDLPSLLRRLARPALLCVTVAAVGALIAPYLPERWVGDGALTPLDTAVVLGGSAAIVLAGMAFARALRTGDHGRALVAVWTGLGFLYATIASTGIAVVGRRRSAKPLVARIEGALPEGGHLTLCGIAPDTTLPILFYFRDSDRIEVARDDAACVRDAPAGSYLMAESEWLRMQRSGDDRFLWRERLRGELRGWSRRLGVVFAERVPSGDAAGADRLAEKELGRSRSQQVADCADLLIAASGIEAPRNVVEVGNTDEEVTRAREDLVLDLGEKQASESLTFAAGGDGEELEVVAAEKLKPDERDSRRLAGALEDPPLAPTQRWREERLPIAFLVAESSPGIPVGQHGDDRIPIFRFVRAHRRPIARRCSHASSPPA